MSYKILLVDDNAILRRTIRFWLEQNTDWIVCGEAENGAIAVERVEEVHPDVVLLDYAMPVMNGLEAARRISKIAPHVLMVMFTMYTGNQLLEDAAGAGIRRVISKSEGAADLVPSMQALLNPSAA
jgi:DNA-binding NarL/FixJ family response regulator